jgi:hypothetical protein
LLDLDVLLFFDYPDRLPLVGFLKSLNSLVPLLFSELVLSNDCLREVT